jgi:hypothetical protein
MNPFEFVITIVALVFLYKLVDAWARNKQAQRSDDGVVAEWRHRLDQVEERVRVLERIVTDERFDLKQQFKDLGG